MRDARRAHAQTCSRGAPVPPGAGGAEVVYGVKPLWHSRVAPGRGSFPP
jgi:hypothetical protein